jgi:cell division protein ZapA
MAQVNITINNRKYQVACDDGQEAHLTRLGKYVDKRLSELIAAVGQVGEARLLVMVSLLLTDELSDLYSKKEAGSLVDTHSVGDEEEVCVAIEKLAERIEDIADSCEQA